MVTRIQALRMAAANKLRKRIDYDLSCRLSPEGDLTAWRRATPEERRVCGRRVRLGLKNGLAYGTKRQAALTLDEMIRHTLSGTISWFDVLAPERDGLSA